ncbi:DUF3592 domain-containing protein [Massilia sp. MS-15]|uniref:DUF3592 domain-containing protein n=1 Tax=Massilia sp. MS-15 TaxID=2878200 RepID=UPI001CD3517C|nr:DUF3592 domain-containing protein [Massilia sp. MS-15]MCA1247612.1 hypothetical protein [Massilia sp. MS-15]
MLATTLDKHVKSGAWCVQLRYRYIASHKVFTSSRFSLDAGAACFRDRQHADAMSARFTLGTTIWIRYDPLSPEKALILPTALGVPDILMALFALLVLLAGAFVLTGKTARRPG